MAHSFTQQALPASKPQDTDLYQHMGQHYLPNSVEKRTFHHWVMRVDSDSWLLNAWRAWLETFHCSIRKVHEEAVNRISPEEKNSYFLCPNISQYIGRASRIPRPSLASWARCTWTLQWGERSAPKGPCSSFLWSVQKAQISQRVFLHLLHCSVYFVTQYKDWHIGYYFISH